MTDEEFERLVREAWAAPFTGWDFNYIKDRSHEAPPPWSYRRRVMARFPRVESLLDMDTGGGELLASMAPLPPRTAATEGYAPNLPIARARLEPLGVQVVEHQNEAPLPFPDGSFDLVINRHGGYRVAEVARVLKPGGSFITQQVGGKNSIRLNEMLQEQVYFEYAYWTLDYALRQFSGSQFEIVDQREAFPASDYFDIGAVVYYLKAVSWQVEGFAPERFMEKLAAIHAIIQQQGKFTVLEHRFYIEACKK
jgi:SAM-dependent methyltransferase